MSTTMAAATDGALTREDRLAAGASPENADNDATKSASRTAP